MGINRLNTKSDQVFFDEGSYHKVIVFIKLLTKKIFLNDSMTPKGL